MTSCSLFISLFDASARSSRVKSLCMLACSFCMCYVLVCRECVRSLSTLSLCLCLLLWYLCWSDLLSLLRLKSLLRHLRIPLLNSIYTAKQEARGGRGEHITRPPHETTVDSRRVGRGVVGTCAGTPRRHPTTIPTTHQNARTMTPAILKDVQEAHTAYSESTPPERYALRR